MTEIKKIGGTIIAVAALNTLNAVPEMQSTAESLCFNPRDHLCQVKITNFPERHNERGGHADETIAVTSSETPVSKTFTMNYESLGYVSSESSS